MKTIKKEKKHKKNIFYSIHQYILYKNKTNKERITFLTAFKLRFKF